MKGILTFILFHDECYDVDVVYFVSFADFKTNYLNFISDLTTSPAWELQKMFEKYDYEQMSLEAFDSIFKETLLELIKKYGYGLYTAYYSSIGYMTIDCSDGDECLEDITFCIPIDKLRKLGFNHLFSDSGSEI